MISKKEALEKTISMWTWLSLNPNKHKKDYHQIILKNRKPLVHHCFICQYAAEHNPETKDYCSYCIMKYCWTSKKEMERAEKEKDKISAYCECRGSPYKIWVDSNDSIIKSVVALKIANLARSILKKEKDE